MPKVKASLRPHWKEIDRDQFIEVYRSLRSWQDLAEFWEIPRGQLAYHAFVADRSELYSSFQIPRRYGGHRKIEVPSATLRYLQRIVHESLSRIYKPHRAVHGFVEGKSILSNAETHLNSRFVITMDLEDFFPTISGQRIQKRLEAEPYGLSSRVANAIVSLATNPLGVLPQGSPSSPVIANIMASQLDSELASFVSPYRCRYTRYADDITISTRRERLSPQIARYQNDEGTGQAVLGDRIVAIVTDNGFRINHRKTRVRSHWTRQVCTGLIVNGDRVSVRRSYVRALRSLIYSWSKCGWAHAAKVLADRTGRTAFDERERLFNHVRGKVDYVGMIRGLDDPVYVKLDDQLESIPEGH